MQIFISATTVTGQKFSVLSLLLKVTCAVFRVKNLNCVSNVRIFLAQGGCSSLSLGWAGSWWGRDDCWRSSRPCQQPSSGREIERVSLLKTFRAHRDCRLAPAVSEPRVYGPLQARLSASQVLDPTHSLPIPEISPHSTIPAL